MSVPREENLPRLNQLLHLRPDDQHAPYDAKFYPFTADGLDPVFAVASKNHILIYRLNKRKPSIAQLILDVLDVERSTDIIDFGRMIRFTAWLGPKDLETGAPLVCVAGSNAKIKIIDARTGKLCTTLIGHGGDINDLVISPINLHILASCSADHTIRLWNLDSAHAKQPCVAVCAGEGHADTVLSIAFHPTGGFILSGAQDNAVCLWSVPKLPVDSSVSNETKLIYYPYFSTSELHTNIVDCVAFHGDLILSKAHSERCIVLWYIIGFSSAISPESVSAPTQSSKGRGTRSAFSSPPSRQYMRLLQFATPDCWSFYMRFSLYSSNATQVVHPILAICNSKSQVFFWDLTRFEKYHAYLESLNPVNYVQAESRPHVPLLRPPWLMSTTRRRKKKTGLVHDWRRVTELSIAESTATASSMHTSSTETLLDGTGDIAEGLKRKYEMGSPFDMAEAHWKEALPKSNFEVTGRQVAWSVCGRWCVVVGEPEVIAVFEKGA